MPIKNETTEDHGKRHVIYKITGSPEERKKDLEGLRKTLKNNLPLLENLTLKTFNENNHDTICYERESPIGSISRNTIGLPPGDLLGISLNPMYDPITRFNAGIGFENYQRGAHHHLFGSK